MKKRTVFTILALTVTVSMALTGCFGQQKEEEVVVEESTFPEDTEEEKEPEATPEPAAAPDVQTTTYLSKNKLISIQLPDATWLNKTDEENLFNFESKDQGSILITHASGEDVSDVQIPDTEANAIAIEEAAELKEGTDFELADFTVSDAEDGNVSYSYQLKMLDPEKADYAYVLVKVFANDEEYFNIRGTVKPDDTQILDKVKEAVDSVGISADSSLSALAPMKENIAALAADDSASADGTEGVPADTEASGDADESESSEGDSGDNAIQGIAPSRDNPNNSDTNLTRTIYRNSDGYPIVISADSNGNWVDENGNVYRFADNEIDVYDQDDVDYYWHGEAADVYYMPVE